MISIFWEITELETEETLLTKNGLILRPIDIDKKQQNSICKAAEDAYIEKISYFSGEDFFGDYESFTNTSKVDKERPGFGYILYQNELVGFLLDHDIELTNGTFIFQEFSQMFPGKAVYVDERDTSSGHWKTTFRLVETNPRKPREAVKPNGEKAEYATIYLGDMGAYYVLVKLAFSEFLKVACQSQDQTYVGYWARFTMDRHYYCEMNSDVERCVADIPMNVEMKFYLETKEQECFLVKFAQESHKMLDTAKYGMVYLKGTGKLC